MSAIEAALGIDDYGNSVQDLVKEHNEGYGMVFNTFRVLGAVFVFGVLVTSINAYSQFQTNTLNSGTMNWNLILSLFAFITVAILGGMLVYRWYVNKNREVRYLPPEEQREMNLSMGNTAWSV